MKFPKFSEKNGVDATQARLFKFVRSSLTAFRAICVTHRILLFAAILSFRLSSCLSVIDTIKNRMQKQN